MGALYIGLMSGTSLDGVDAVLADFATPPGRVLGHVARAFAAPLRAEELLNVHPAVWATLTFGATPGTAVISSRWDLAAWWESGGEGAPAEVPEGQALLVWRDAEDDVQQEALRSEDAEAARRLLAGAPFAEVCEAFAPEDAGEAEAEEAGRRALELLLRLVARRGLVCTLHSARSRRV